MTRVTTKMPKTIETNPKMAPKRTQEWAPSRSHKMEPRGALIPSDSMALGPLGPKKLKI